MQKMEQQPTKMERLLFEMKKVIVGQDHLLERILVALLARGHLLVEGVPGLAKTLSVKTLAAAIEGDFKRVQFTPDLVPADLVGTRVYDQRTGEFQTWLGPVFTNLLLGDEINRAPAKVQSALLEVMQERQVTIGKETHTVPDPFLVMATQNPIETEGTYPLPEAQVDRFLFKVLVDYPTLGEEASVVGRSLRPPEDVAVRLSMPELERFQRAAREIFVDREVVAYAVQLVDGTRHPERYGLTDLSELIQYGSSPRGAIGMVQAGQALALLRGRRHVLVDDIRDLAPDVLRHRLVLSYDALSDDITADDILDRLLSTFGAAPDHATAPAGYDAA